MVGVRATVLCLALATACSTATPPDSAQRSRARGAREPIQASVIVGSEGKGMFTGAGIPPDNMPIYAARDGATPVPFASLCREMWLAAQQMLGPGHDHTEMALLLEKIAKTELR